MSVYNLLFASEILTQIWWVEGSQLCGHTFNYFLFSHNSLNSLDSSGYMTNPDKDKPMVSLHFKVHLRL